jgi:hypothetical protein
VRASRLLVSGVVSFLACVHYMAGFPCRAFCMNVLGLQSPASPPIREAPLRAAVLLHPLIPGPRHLFLVHVCSTNILPANLWMDYVSVTITF